MNRREFLARLGLACASVAIPAAAAKVTLDNLPVPSGDSVWKWSVDEEGYVVGWNRIFYRESADHSPPPDGFRVEGRCLWRGEDGKTVCDTLIRQMRVVPEE